MARGVKKGPDLTRNRMAAENAVRHWDQAALESEEAAKSLAKSTGLSVMDAQGVVASEITFRRRD